MSSNSNNVNSDNQGEVCHANHHCTDTNVEDQLIPGFLEIHKKYHNIYDNISIILTIT